MSQLALEGLGTPEALARRYANATVTDDLGRPCLTRDTAARALSEHRARQHAARDSRAYPALPDTALASRGRVKALAAQQRAAGLEVGDLPMSTASYATLTSAHHADRLDQSAGHLDEMLAGRDGSIAYHPVNKEQ